jgi:nucleoside-diphosphate-sugar epimerase
MAAKRVLVTGGGGFLGSAVVKLLVQRGDKVRSFSRKRYPELEKLGVEQFQGDLADREAVMRAVVGMETVFHVAAKAGVWGPYKEYHRANVMGTENLIAAVQAAKVARIVYTSSPSVVFDGRPMEGVDESAPYPSSHTTHYPKTKAMAERMVIAAAADGLAAIILRPHQIWGPGDLHFAPRVIQRAKQLARVGDGRNKVDTIYIDNAAKAHLLAEDALIRDSSLSGRIYFISQDDPIPLWEMIDNILVAAGLPKINRSIPAAAAYGIGAFLEMFYWLFRIRKEPRMTRFLARALSKSHWFDISAAKRDLEYVPEVSTAEGLKRLAEWLQKQRF